MVTIYPGFENVLPNVDYLVASSEFPGRWTRIDDPFRALEKLQNDYGMKVAAMTLGAHGALARVNGQFVYAPAVRRSIVSTPPARETCSTEPSAMLFWKICRSIRRSSSRNAMAALNCLGLGARGHIGGLRRNPPSHRTWRGAASDPSSNRPAPHGSAKCFPYATISRCTRFLWRPSPSLR